MAQKRPRPPGCWGQDGRGGSLNRRETAINLVRARGDRKSPTVYSGRESGCPTCGAPPATRPVLEVDVELQEVLPRTRHGNVGRGKPKASDLERRMREVRRSPNPWVEVERIRQEFFLGQDGWTEQIASIYGIVPP